LLSKLSHHPAPQQSFLWLLLLLLLGLRLRRDADGTSIAVTIERILTEPTLCRLSLPLLSLDDQLSSDVEIDTFLLWKFSVSSSDGQNVYSPLWANSAFHPSGAGKGEPASTGNVKGVHGSFHLWI